MAAGALAAPLQNRDLEIVEEIFTVTTTVTEGFIPESTSVVLYQPPAVSSTTMAASDNVPATTAAANVVVPATPSATAVAQPAPPASVQPSSTSSASTSASSGSASNDMLAVINKWRGKYGLNDLTWNEEMVQNSAQVGENGGGVKQIHTLIPNTAMGQVITPGQINPVPADQDGYSPFEVAYIGWLCEVSTDPQLQASENDGVDVCGLVQKVLNMDYTETAHHDILVSPAYNSAGCAYTANPNADQETATYQGLYVCGLDQ